MSSITKDQLIFDTSATADSDNIGAYIRSSDGTLIDHTTIDTVDRLAVDSTLKDGAGVALTSTLVGADQALDVNVANDVSVTIASDPTHYAEDAAHTSGDTGQFMLGIRQDADTSPVDADGDYHPFVFDANGALKVRANVVATVEPSDAEYAEDSAHTTGDVGLSMLAVRQDTLAASVDTDGDYATLKLDSLGRLYTTAAVSGDVADDAADSGNPLKIGSRAVDQASALTAVSAADDRADQISDLYRRVMVNTSPNIGLSAVAQSVTATAAQLAATPLAGRTRMLIQNAGNNEVYLGGAAVTAADGIILRRRTSIELPLGEALALYAVCDTAETSELRLLQLA